VTAVQRFGGGLNLNVHFHTLALDGVFVQSPAGPLAFLPARGPSDVEVAQVLGTIRRRVGRLLRRRGLEPGEDGMGPEDPVAEASLLVLYHGVLAPHARWRPEVVAYRRAERIEAAGPSEMGISTWMKDSGAERPRHWTWAALMRRAFDLDVLRCPRCAGRMQLIATIDDPAVIQRILAHLGLPGARDGPPLPSSVSTARARQPALLSGSL